MHPISPPRLELLQFAGLARYDLQAGPTFHRVHSPLSVAHELSTKAMGLQWGRRVNTAECLGGFRDVLVELRASMGPPREHGGMPISLMSTKFNETLQWGRRVNTAECLTTLGRSWRRRCCFNGAAA